jgi:hypothetical protein
MSWMSDLASALGIPARAATLAVGHEGRLPHSEISAYAGQLGRASPRNLLASCGSPSRLIAVFELTL